jgi:peptide/nickel transport system permease protein
MLAEVSTRSEIIRKFSRSKSGIAGVLLLLALVLMSVYAAVAVPLESFRQWYNPAIWIDLPKSAAPAWTNLGLGPKQPEHIILDEQDATITTSLEGGARVVVHSYNVAFNYDSFPNDLMFLYSLSYGDTQPIVQIDILRPDGYEFEQLYYVPLPPPQQDRDNQFSGRVFSTDRSITSALRGHLSSFDYPQQASAPHVMIFSDLRENEVLKGTYTIREKFVLFDAADSVTGSGVIIGGKVYGIMGTDELRRDLSIGILWGAPVALFIGLTVAIAGVIIGLIYGVVAGYKGSRADEGMMRVNDIFYSLPALPILVILSVTIGSNLFLITGFLVIFGWVGMAKVSRSIALQLKNMPYVEASKLMGQSDSKIIFKHIIPQLLPLTFASIAISVPGAILGEATLSFLGLSDPSIPTWGQILHDANSAGAASRGLWWWIVPPGLMIAMTGLAFVLIGNALDAIVNPRRRRK